MQMEAIESSQIAERGYDPETAIMALRFKNNDGSPGSLYEYENVSAPLYAEGCAYIHPKTGKLSFGSWFIGTIKKNPNLFPYRKIEASAPKPAPTATVDVTPAGLVPVEADELVVEIPTEVEALKTNAELLSHKAGELITANGSPITITDPDKYRLAGLTVLTIAKMRTALAQELDPEIKRCHEAHKSALAVKNRYDKPLEEDERRLDAAMSDYKRREHLQRLKVEEETRREQVRLAEEEASRVAQERHIEDAVAMAESGAPEVAEQMLASEPLPVAPRYTAPIHVPSSVPKVAGISDRQGWGYEVTDEALLPENYILRTPDHKSLKARVDQLGDKANIPGIRIFETFTQAKKRK